MKKIEIDKTVFAILGNVILKKARTAVLAYKILIEAFNNLNLGYASAIAVVLFVIMLILSGLNVAVSKKYLK